MDNLDKLEKKVTDNVVKVEFDIQQELSRIYKLISNTNEREEFRLKNIERKVDYVVNEIKNVNLTEEEKQKQEKIKELEQKLNKLKGES